MAGLRERQAGQAQPLIGHQDSVLCLYRVPGSDLTLLSGAADATVRIWDPVRSSQAVQSIRLECQSVNSVVCVDDHHIFVAAGSDLYRFDRRRTEEAVELVHCADDEINQISVLDRHMVWCDDTGAVTMASIRPDSSLDIDLSIEAAHDNICTSVQICPGPDDHVPIVYSAGMDCKIRVWDLDGDEVESLESNLPTTSESSGFQQPSMIHWLSCSGDGGLVAAGLQSADIVLADTRIYSIVRLHAHTSIVTNVHFAAFAPRNILLSASSDSTLVLWNLDPSTLRDSDTLSGFSPAERSLFDVNLIQSRIRLDYKPNDVATSMQGQIFVADTSPDIHVYHVL